MGHDWNASDRRKPLTAGMAEGTPLPTADGLHVLLCVDNPVDGLVVTELLRVASDVQPLDITQVGTLDELVAGYDALRHDVVLLDLDGADPRAFEAIALLLGRDRDASVVVLVGPEADAAGEAALRAGAQDVVTKGGLTGSSLRRILRYAHGRKAALRELRAQKAFADSLIASMPGVFTLLDEASRVLRWNDAIERLLGRMPEELAGAPFIDFVTPQDRTRAADTLAAAYRSGGASIEVGLASRTGAAVPFYLTGARIEWEGRPCLIVTGQDLSDRQAMESQLVHAEKMDSVGRLAGGVAHDFNNMLATVLAFSELLLLDAPDDPRRADVETIRDAAMGATGLTRQLLAFSRRQVYMPRATDLNVLLADLDRLVRRVIGEEIEVVLSLGAHLGLVEVDPGQIESAIMNMVINARDAMPEGGTLTLETVNVELPPPGPDAPDGLSGPAVRLTITDTGHGMTDEVKGHLFEPFFTTKGQGIGTGLGLPSVYGIVRQCRGRIRVASEVDRGTIFTIDLPRIEAAAAASAETDGAGIAGGTETLLIAEDNDLVRRGVAATLGARGYTVLQARDGEEAVALAASHPGVIHLMLADVVMPRMAVWELCEKVRTLRPQMRMVFMSGYMNESLDSVREWASAFVQKPFTVQALARTLRGVLDEDR